LKMNLFDFSIRLSVVEFPTMSFVFYDKRFVGLRKCFSLLGENVLFTVWRNSYEKEKNEKYCVR
jgi:hypothetical protein